MSDLASYILSLALLLGPGKKVHSLELRPDCGSDPKAPTCELKPVCDQPTILCAPPQWESCFWGWKQTFPLKKDEKTGNMVETKPPVCHPWRDEPGAWVQIESRDVAAQRFVVISQAIADAAEAVGAEWPEGTRDFARAELVQSYWSTGLREDIERGRTRGPGGEVCLMDMKPDTLRKNAPELASLPNEDMIAQVIGLEYPELRRCYEAGGRALLSARRARRWTCPNRDPLLATFALYHTGSECTSRALGWKWCPECKRFDSMNHFRARKYTLFPDWFHLQE